MNFIKLTLVFIGLIIVGGLAFLIWAGGSWDIEAPSPKDYAPNFWFDSEEDYYPASPLAFYYDGNLNEISGSEAKSKYDSLSLEQKLRNFTIFYKIKSEAGQWIYEYWPFYVFNVYDINEHYGDWEPIYVFVDKDTRKVNKIVTSAHIGSTIGNYLFILPFSNNEANYSESGHVRILIERGAHANWPDGDQNGLVNKIGDVTNWYNAFRIKNWSREDKLHGVKVNYDNPNYKLERLMDLEEKLEGRESFTKSPTLGSLPVKIGSKTYYFLPFGGAPADLAYLQSVDDLERAKPITTESVIAGITGFGETVLGKIQGAGQLVQNTAENLFGWVKNSFSELTAQIGSIFKGSEPEGEYIPLDSAYPSLPVEEEEEEEEDVVDDRSLKATTPKAATPDEDTDDSGLKSAIPDEGSATPDERKKEVKEEIDEEEEEKRVSGRVIINEIAWMGTAASYNDEWIELYNQESYPINLSGWVLKAEDGSPNIKLSDTIEAQGYFLLERTDDNTVSDILADQIYSGALSNNGENLILTDYAGSIIDQVDCSAGWFGGDNSSKKTMERNRTDGTNRTNKSDGSDWHTNDGLTTNGQDAGSNPILGTPKAENSTGQSEEKKEEETEEETAEEDEEQLIEEEEQKEQQEAEKPAKIVINEIMYDLEGSDEGREWVEIYNAGENSVDLTGWRFYEDDVNHGLSLHQGEIILPPSSYALIVDNPQRFFSDYSNYSGTLFDSSFSLSNTGEIIAIRDSNSNVIDQVTYSSDWGAKGDGNSLQRKASDSDSNTFSNWQVGIPTPGALNLTKGAFSSGGGSSGYSSSPPEESSEQGNEEGEEVVEGEREGKVVINEIAWMGTQADYNDEWIELYNLETYAVDLFGWVLKALDGSPEIELSGTVQSQGYYLLERSDDSTVSDIEADQIYNGALSNDGENFTLQDYLGGIIDKVDSTLGWFAGENGSKKSMERTNLALSGSDSENWHTNSGKTINGLDVEGNPILGTPKALNSEGGNEGEGSEEGESEGEEGTKEEPEEGSENPEENILPIASFTFSPQNSIVEGIITFDASSSTDPNGEILSFNWDFGDDNATTTPWSIITHFYTAVKDYIVGLTVIDNDGATGNATSTVSVSEAEEEEEEEEEEGEEEEEEEEESPQIVINEIMYDLEGSDESREWVEIFNAGENSVDLTGWKFYEADTNHNLNLYQGEITTPPNGYVLIVDEPDGFFSGYPDYSGTLFDSSFSLKNSGEFIALKDSEGNFIDQLTYSSDWGAKGDGNSLQRKTPEGDSNDASNWYKAPPTPGALNEEEGTTPPALVPTIIPDWWSATTTVTWTLEGSPYILESSSNQYPTVEEGATLIIEPGVKIKGKNKHYPSLLVKGTLEAEGTAEEPIIFTADIENPQPGDWKGIVFEGSEGSVLDNVEFRYGGFESDEMIRVENSEIAISNSTFRDSINGIIYAIDSDIDIEDSTFLDSEGGIYARGDAAAITVANSEFRDLDFYGIKAENGANLGLQDNLFVNITKYPIEITSAYPTLSGNSAENCGVNGVYFNSNSVFGQDFTLKLDLPYVLQSNLGEQVTVAERTTLTLEPGVVLKAALSGGGIPQQYDTLLIKGTLIAQGGETTSTKIVFTSFKDDEYGGDTNNDGIAGVDDGADEPAPGDWKRIVFASSSTDSILENVLFRYGGPEDEIITIEGEQEASEEEVLDQETVNGLAWQAPMFMEGRIFGQTFTVGQQVDNIKIFRASLRKAYPSTSGMIYLNIYETEGGFPTGESLGHASFDGTGAIGIGWTWVDFIFPEEISLNPGTRYAAVMGTENGEFPIGRYKWQYVDKTLEDYLGGTAVKLFGREEELEKDFMFQTWYLPPADTESPKVDMINVEKEYCL